MSTRIAPPAHSIFEPVADRYGLRLALVFGNHAPGGKCPYYVGSRCYHCDIGASEGVAFSLKDNEQRLEWFRKHYANVLGDVAHLVIYNSGSVLNPLEMPADVLALILRFAGELSQLQTVSLDSREPFIRRTSLVAAAEQLPPEVSLRPILGLESADDRLRNGLLEKQMPRAAIEKAFTEIAGAGQSVGPGRVGIDVNILIGGPGALGEAAVTDARATARYSLKLARQAKLPIDFNLHPYYPSVRGKERFGTHPRCTLDQLGDAVVAIAELTAHQTSTGIFVGWQDEGHDTEQNLRNQELSKAVRVLEHFNRTQDLQIIKDWRP